MSIQKKVINNSFVDNNNYYYYCKIDVPTRIAATEDNDGLLTNKDLLADKGDWILCIYY